MFRKRKRTVIDRLSELNPEPRGTTQGEPPPIRRRPIKFLGLAAAGLAAALVIIALLGGEGAGPVEEPAFAQEAIEVAEGNPRLLIGADGWSVDFAGEFEVDHGNIDFVNGEERLAIDWEDPRYYSETEIPEQGLGEWSGPSRLIKCSEEVEPGEKKGDYVPGGQIVTEEGERIPLKIVDCAISYRVSEVSLLGQTVFVEEAQQRIEGEDPTSTFTVKVPPAGGVYVLISGYEMSAERFREVLDSIYSADVDTWLAALPPDVVQPIDRPAVVAEMLDGLPIHPDVDVDELEEEAGALTRYHLGAKVSGAVACAWLDQWAAGVKAGDQQAIDEATEAMADSRDWPILEEMADEGGWSQVIWEYSREMEQDDRQALLGSAGTETIDDKTYELGPSYATGIGCDSEKRTLREE